MENDLTIFKRCLEAGASEYGLKYGELIRARGINDFLIDESLNPSPPKEFAAKALSQLCVGDGYSMDRCICSAISVFLNETCNNARDYRV